MISLSLDPAGMNFPRRVWDDRCPQNPDPLSLRLHAIATSPEGFFRRDLRNNFGFPSEGGSNLAQDC